MTDLHTPRELTRQQALVVIASVLTIAACGIVYELNMATVSSYLLGDSVYQFSITIGLFMAAMGAGAFASRKVTGSMLDIFVATEVALALVGGLSSVILFSVFPYPGLYAPTMYVLIGVIGGLVGLEIPLIVRMLSDRGGVRRGVADALSLDYLGALLGSLAFPLLMLPALGLFRSAFVVGLMNAGVGVLNALAFRDHLRYPRVWAAASLLIAAGLTAGMFQNERISRYAEDALYGGRVVHREQSPYQRIVLTADETTHETRLYLDGHIQFAEFDEYRYHEALVHPLMGLEGTNENVLILGGGDGLAAREVLGFPGVEHTTLVDLDPAITTLAQRFAPLRRLNQESLAHPKVEVVHEDAFRYVRENTKTYQRIIIDLPDPHNEALAKLYSVEFYRMARACLSKNGALAVQSSSPFFTPKVFGSIRQTLEAAGFAVTSYHVNVPAFGPWGFHLATLPDTGTTIHWRPDAKFMSAEVFAAAGVLPRDMALRKPGVNSVFNPLLYVFYREEIRRGPQSTQE